MPINALLPYSYAHPARSKLGPAPGMITVSTDRASYLPKRQYPSAHLRTPSPGDGLWAVGSGLWRGVDELRLQRDGVECCATCLPDVQQACQQYENDVPLVEAAWRDYSLGCKRNPRWLQLPAQIAFAHECSGPTSCSCQLNCCFRYGVACSKQPR